jgi:hypothetical protein
MLFDTGLDKQHPESFQTLESTDLVVAHQTRVADNIGSKYGSQPTFQDRSPLAEAYCSKGRESIGHFS